MLKLKEYILYEASGTSGTVISDDGTNDGTNLTTKPVEISTKSYIHVCRCWNSNYRDWISIF